MRSYLRVELQAEQHQHRRNIEEAARNAPGVVIEYGLKTQAYQVDDEATHLRLESALSSEAIECSVGTHEWRELTS